MTVLAKRSSLGLLHWGLSPIRKNSKILLVLLVAFSLLMSLFIASLLLAGGKSKVDVFVGIDIGYGNEADVRKIVDRAGGYINLVILGSLQLTTDTQKLTNICDYLYEKGLYFIVYTEYPQDMQSLPRGPDSAFFTMAKARWNEKFLGIYLFDEAGGKQIDQKHALVGPDLNSTDITEVAINYVHHLNWFLGNITGYYSPASPKLYTSDYALNWFDYVSGYDVVFTEFAANNSREIAIALGRGAARSLNKDWGVMITWKYGGYPFLPEANQLNDEMTLAYQNGAKYIVVFNSPENQTATEYGSLQTGHLASMQGFWDHIKNNPRGIDSMPSNAFVLPTDYGYGFRGANDKLWGLWDGDALTKKIWSDVNLMLEHGSAFDIVYETKIGDTPLELPYNALVYWNGTVTSNG